MDVRKAHDGNRDAWDRAARSKYAALVEEDVAFLRAGKANLFEPERATLLPLLQGARVIHLQCSHGLDLLSLWNLGAKEVVGVDISREMLAQARAKSEELDAPATWVESDILHTPHELDGTADIVYTGKGAVPWMHDLDAWAAVVARLLRPGGHFYVFEGHPLDFVWRLDAREYVLAEGTSYFQTDPLINRTFPTEAARADEPERPVRVSERVWTVGQVVTALAEAGLRILRVEEHPELFWNQFPELDRELVPRLPHTFSVLARRD